MGLGNSRYRANKAKALTFWDFFATQGVSEMYGRKKRHRQALSCAGSSHIPGEGASSGHLSLKVFGRALPSGDHLE